MDLGGFPYGFGAVVATPVNLSAMRKEYESSGLDFAQMPTDPFVIWRQWLDDAVDADLPEPNAMVISTVAVAKTFGDPPQPSSRIVLCKGISSNGFEFYTNYGSRKSLELQATGTVAATFPWISLSRQVNIVGRAEQMSALESDRYWSQRDRGAQLGAWASIQSEELQSYEELEERYRHFETMYPGLIPRPSHWGGWRIVPETVEFWQGRQNRLHDRLLYRVSPAGFWSTNRLSP